MSQRPHRTNSNRRGQLGSNNYPVDQSQLSAPQQQDLAATRRDYEARIQQARDEEARLYHPAPAATLDPRVLINPGGQYNPTQDPDYNNYGPGSIGANSHVPGAFRDPRSGSMTHPHVIRDPPNAPSESTPVPRVPQLQRESFEPSYGYGGAIQGGDQTQDTSQSQVIDTDELEILKASQMLWDQDEDEAKYNKSNAKFSTTITNFNDAIEQLFNPNTTYYKLSIENDDVGDVEKRVYHYAKLIFDGLLHLPEPPEGLDKGKKAEYEKKQSDWLKNCKKWMATEQDLEDASARCMLAVDVVLKLHKRGIPENRLASALEKQNNTSGEKEAKKPPKLRTGYYVDISTKCSSRLEQMAAVVRENKLVVKDLLTLVDKVPDIAYDVNGYVSRKKGNLRCNNSKAKQMKLGKKAKEQEEAQSAAVETEDQDDDDDDDAQEAQGVKKPLASKKRKSALNAEDDDAPPAKSTRAKTRRRAAETAEED